MLFLFTPLLPTQFFLGLQPLILALSYKPSQYLFQCLIAIVPWADKALMNTKWKGMPQFYIAKWDVLEWI